MGNQHFAPYLLWNWPVRPFQGLYSCCLVTFVTVCSQRHPLMEMANSVAPVEEAVVAEGSTFEVDEMAEKIA